MAIKTKLDSLKSGINAFGAAFRASEELISVNSVAGASVTDLADAFSYLTPKKMAELSVSRDLSEASFIEAVSRAKISDEAKKEAIETFKAAKNKEVDKNATDKVTISTQNLSAAIKGVVKNIKTLFATSPVAWILATVAALAAVTFIFDKITTSIPEQAEKVQKLREEYEALSSELKSVETELETTQSKISELESQEVLSLVEKGELETLRSTNYELAREVSLLRQRNQEAKEELEREAADGWKSMNTEAYHTVQGIYDTEVSSTPLTDVEYVDWAIKELDNIQQELDKLWADGVLEGKEKSLARGYELLKKQHTQGLEGIRDTAVDLGTDASNALAEKIYAALDPSFAYEHLDATIPSVLKNMGEAISALIEDQSSDQVDGVTESIERQVSTLMRNKDFESWVNSAYNMGVITDTTTESVWGLVESVFAVSPSIAEALESVDLFSEHLKRDSDLLHSAIEKISSGDIASIFTTSSIEEILEAFPNLVDELKAYQDGLIDAEQLQVAFNNAIIDFNTDAVYDGINDIISATKTYGAESNQVKQAIQNLEQIIPGLTDVLYDQETGHLKVGDSALLSAASIYEAADAAIEMTKQSAAANFTTIITEYQDLAAAAMAAYGSMSVAGRVAREEARNQADWEKVHGEGTGYTTLFDEKGLEEYNKYLDNIISSIDNAFSRYKREDNSDDPWKDAFEAEYNRRKHLLEMEQITLEDFYAWLEGANAHYFANNSKYLEEYRKYSEEVFGGLKDLATDFADEEHQIFLWEQAGGHTGEIIDEYRNIQDALHAEAERYRKEQLPLLMAQGYDEKTAKDIIEDSEYIQELSKMWWGYEDDISSALDAADDKLQKHLTAGEHDIFLMEQNGISENAIIAKYRSMQDALHETAEEIRGFMRDAGYSELEIENSELIASLSEQWWGYEDAINETKQKVIDDIKEMVSAASEAVDSVQDIYDTLHSIADEYAANEGFISVDSFQKIAELGPETLKYLHDENGMLEITEENIKKVIAAKTEQLAVDSAMAYVERLRIALQEGSIEDLNELLMITNETTNSTWGLVYANLALLDLTDDQHKAALANINSLRALADNAISGIGKATGTLTDSLNDMKTGLDDILQYVMDMIKSNIEQEIEGIEDAKDAYAELIEQKKKSLEAAEDEKDYQDDVAEKIKEIAELQERIDALALDDSREAQAERARLMEEQAELQKDLDDTQRDHAIETQQDSLDEMQEAYEKQKDEEIEVLEDSISSTQKLYDMAIDYIEDNWDTLYRELIAWNYEYGNSLETEITTAWDNCVKAVERYGSVAAAVANLPGDVEAAGTSGSSTTVGRTGDYDTTATVKDQVSILIDRMKKRSASYETIKKDPKVLAETLKEQDQDAAKIAALIGRRVVKDEPHGIWYIDKIGGEQLYTNWEKYCYHTGGIAGDMGTLKENELLAKLEEGEAIISNKNKGVLFSLIDFVSKLSRKLDFGGLNNINHPLTKVTEGLKQVTAGTSSSIHFGDVYIYGANEQTVEKHREVNREFTSQIIKQLGINKR